MQRPAWQFGLVAAVALLCATPARAQTRPNPDVPADHADRQPHS